MNTRLCDVTLEIGLDLFITNFRGLSVGCVTRYSREKEVEDQNEQFFNEKLNLQILPHCRLISIKVKHKSAMM